MERKDKKRRKQSSSETSPPRPSPTPPLNDVVVNESPKKKNKELDLKIGDKKMKPPDSSRVTRREKVELRERMPLDSSLFVKSSRNPAANKLPSSEKKEDITMNTIPEENEEEDEHDDEGEEEEEEWPEEVMDLLSPPSKYEDLEYDSSPCF